MRYIRPTTEFPEIRLRFTPAKGLIYGPTATAGRQAAIPVIPATSRAIYDRTQGQVASASAPTDDAGKPKSFATKPCRRRCIAIDPPAPSWLNHNVAISRGYLDDACDGFVEVRLTLPGRQQLLVATARICAGPPAVVPDSLFVRSLADDLDQVIHGPTWRTDEPEAVTRARAQDIVRRAYETVRFMNVAVMNGNDFKGRSALSLDSMPEEEAADTQRADPPGHVARHRRHASPSSPCTSRSIAALRGGRRRGSCACCAGRTRSPTSPTAAGARCRR